MYATTMMRAVEGPPGDLSDDPARDARGAAVTASVRHDFDELFRRDGAGVYRTLYAFSGGRRDIAEDATSEAFARAIVYARTIRDPLAWIYRTAFRLAARELKADAQRGEIAHEAATLDATDAGELIAALRKLSPNQRAAVVLRFEADLPVNEVARRMGVSAPTVRVHIHRARARLRDLLGTEELTEP
jgi:RNA polymerase sigma-70 factor (ECF subfamily)